MSDVLKRRAFALMLATALAIPAEGIRQRAYFDPPGILTVCRGHTGADVDPRKFYTVAECDALLSADMRRAVALEPGEKVVFSWIVWPDKATADASHAKIMDDPRAADFGEMPFDGKRMIFGGFQSVVDVNNACLKSRLATSTA